MAPTLSVALANYNHGRYLRDSLGAICEQTLRPLDVVVVDDGSTDDSVAIIEDFARRYPFLTLIKNERNRGALYSLNLAISRTKGDYVICPASDDRLERTLFEKTSTLLAKHPGAGLCSALVGLLGERGEDLGPFRTPVISRTPCFVPAERFLETFRTHGNWMMTMTTFYSRAGLSEFGGGFDGELGPAADGFLAYALAAKYGACFIPERLGAWRKLDDSFALKTAADDVEGALRLADAMDRKLRATGLFPEDFLERSMRSALMATLYEINRRRPDRFDAISLLATRLQKKTWRDRLFFAWIGKTKIARRAASKLYLFLYQPSAERRRIAWQKAKSWLGGAR